MFQLKLMDGTKFNILKEDVNMLSGKSGLVFLSSINGFINISSISSILPVELGNSDRRQNKDGQWCVKKFGQWVLENDQEVRVDLRYYPELESGELKKKELPSEFAKKLANKF